MKEAPVWVAVLLAAASSMVSSRAAAQGEAPCSLRIDRSNLVPCALAASLASKIQEHEIEAAEGRGLAVLPWLPSNPVVAGSIARRWIEPGVQTTNWEIALSQELEVAGQRGLRRASAESEIEAEEAKLFVAERDAAGAAWAAYFEVLAAQEQQGLAARLAAAMRKVSTVARARADQGLGAPIDADLAETATVRVLQSSIAAEREEALARANLLSLLGVDPWSHNPVVAGRLAPPDELANAKAVPGADLPARPELRALAAQQRSFERRADAIRRARVPNPTVSLFAQDDGLNEKVLGVGLSLPIPIPGPMGRTHDGEIAEATALALRAGTERAQIERDLRLRLARAAATFEARKKEIGAFSPAHLERAEQSLRDLASEVEAGRLAIRDALFAEQTLIELLQSFVAAKRALCLASIELAQAAGFPWETYPR